MITGTAGGRMQGLAAINFIKNTVCTVFAGRN